MPPEPWGIVEVVGEMVVSTLSEVEFARLLTSESFTMIEHLVQQFTANSFLLILRLRNWSWNMESPQKLPPLNKAFIECPEFLESHDSFL